MIDSANAKAPATKDVVDENRRSVLAGLTKAAYVAPATIAMLAVEAHAVSSPPP